MITSVTMYAVYILCILLIGASALEKPKEKCVNQEDIDKLSARMDSLTKDVHRIFEKRFEALESQMVKLIANGIPAPESKAAELKEVTPFMNNTDLEERVDALEFQMANVQEDVGTISSDTRLSKLELDGTVAFHVGFSANHPNIPVGSTAIFDAIHINLGNGYNSDTGEFVVPAGSAGLYYFYAHYLFGAGELQYLNIRHNGNYLCKAFEDNIRSGDSGGSSCGAIVVLQEGDCHPKIHLYLLKSFAKSNPRQFLFFSNV